MGQTIIYISNGHGVWEVYIVNLKPGDKPNSHQWSFWNELGRNGKKIRS